MDDAELAPQQDDPLARLKARKAASAPQDDPLQRLLARKQRSAPTVTPARAAGPITPTHSKFSPDELKAHADQSVDDATNETMDAQGDLIRTLQTGVAAVDMAPSLALRSGGRLLDLVRSSKAGDGASRVIGAVRNGVRAMRGGVEAIPEAPFSPKSLADAPKPLIEPAITRIETQSPIQTTLSRSSSPVTSLARARSSAPHVEIPQTLERTIETQSPADAVMESPLSKARSALPESWQPRPPVEHVKGYPISGDPPTNWDLMQRLESSLLKAKGKGGTPRVPTYRP